MKEEDTKDTKDTKKTKKNDDCGGTLYKEDCGKIFFPDFELIGINE